MESPVAESVLYPVQQYGMPLRTMVVSIVITAFFALLFSMPLDWQAIVPYVGDALYLVPWGCVLLWAGVVKGLVYRNPFLENCWIIRFFPPSTHYTRADNMIAGRKVRFGARRWRLEV